MIVKGPDGKPVQRCDACAKLALTGDLFKQMILPSKEWVIKQALSRRLPLPPELPPDWFTGIGKESEPKSPAQLHFCPACEHKVKAAIFQGKVSELPPGPLRDVLQRMKLRDPKRLRLH